MNQRETQTTQRNLLVHLLASFARVSSHACNLMRLVQFNMSPATQLNRPPLPIGNIKTQAQKIDRALGRAPAWPGESQRPSASSRRRHFAFCVSNLRRFGQTDLNISRILLAAAAATRTGRHIRLSTAAANAQEQRPAPSAPDRRVGPELCALRRARDATHTQTHTLRNSNQVN